MAQYAHMNHFMSAPHAAHRRYLVTEARKLGVADIIDRCNLTVLMEPGQEDLPAFLAEHRVHVVASLPCYSSENVDAQRGFGVFERSIEGLKVGGGQGLLLCSTRPEGGERVFWGIGVVVQRSSRVRREGML